MSSTINSEIERNLVTNLVRIFTEYGLDLPKDHNSKIAHIRHGLYHGEATSYKADLARIIQVRRRDNKWGLYTSTFLEGVLSLLNNYCTKKNLFNAKSPKVKPTFELNVSKDNIFLTIDHGQKALKRLNSFERTTIRYSLIEEYGEERVAADLAAAAPGAILFIDRENHEPDQLREWLYDEDNTKMTVMYPVMPMVYIKKLS